MKKNTIIIALAGILVGAAATFALQHVAGNRRMHKTEYQDWRKLNLILQCVDENYVDTVDREKVTDAAVKAALAALDPHTIYLEPQSLKDSEDDLAGQFEGIGIQFNVPNDTAIVLEVIPGGPSEKVGLRQGDRLLKVDDKVIAGVKFPQDSMVRRMKGPSGTKVNITVKRGDETIPFEITRGKIPTWSVDAHFMVNDTTGYIRLAKFARTSINEVLKAGTELAAAGMTHMILDLRDNSGGLLDQALAISDLFLPKGAPIVYMEGLHRKREDFSASGKGIFQDMGLTLLINETSASSSEIVAGAIQDNDRGVLVGRRSFGKGLVQEPLFFTDGSGIRVTVARFHTPSGRCIQKPYADDYGIEVYERYDTGEMTDADSIKIDRSVEYKTAGGRVVYGGGGIIPDVFVPVDTTKAGEFYIGCNRKATTMRFASAFFDAHKSQLGSIDDYQELENYLEGANLEEGFLAFARDKDGLQPADGEWAIDKPYMMTQVKALVGRYSRLGDEAFYHIYLEIDEVFKKALTL